MGSTEDTNVLALITAAAPLSTPDDTDALRALAYTASAREDYRAAHDWNQKIVDTGKAEAQDLNGLAWETLFYGRAEGPDIETAIRATQMSQNSPSILHTLACLYAEAGRTKEAREVLIQAMDLKELDEPDAEDIRFKRY